MKPRSVKVFRYNFSPLYFKEWDRLDKFSKNRFLGPHFCWRRSLLGPHLTQNWVLIGSPWHLGAVEMGRCNSNLSLEEFGLKFISTQCLPDNSIHWHSQPCEPSWIYFKFSLTWTDEAPGFQEPAPRPCTAVIQACSGAYTMISMCGIVSFIIISYFKPTGSI